MSRYGVDYSYADTRLTGSIAVTLDGQPILINKISPSSGNASVTYLMEMSEEMPSRQLPLHIDDIEACPVKLGYANSAAAGAVYLCRIPTRRYKQGLTRNENLTAINKNAAHVTWKELGACILGTYPSFQTIIANMNGEGYVNPFEASNKKRNDSSAWHRHWCIKKNLSIEYKGEEIVGKYDAEKKAIILKEEYKYLQEALQESLNANRT